MFSITKHYPESSTFCLLGHDFRIAIIHLVHVLGCSFRTMFSTSKPHPKVLSISTPKPGPKV